MKSTTFTLPPCPSASGDVGAPPLTAGLTPGFQGTALKYGPARAAVRGLRPTKSWRDSKEAKLGTHRPRRRRAGEQDTCPRIKLISQLCFVCHVRCFWRF